MSSFRLENEHRKTILAMMTRLEETARQTGLSNEQRCAYTQLTHEWLQIEHQLARRAFVLSAQVSPERKP